MTDRSDAAATKALIARFLEALSARDTDEIMACVTDDMVHDVNQGGERRDGKDRFKAYVERMQHHYEEVLSDPVIMVSDDGTRAAAEYNLTGRYLQTEEGLPPASGQPYALPAAMFFATSNGLISRVTTYYNLTDWLMQVVSAEPTPPLQ